MIEYVELRISEKYAHLAVGTEGERLDELTRRVRLPLDDPRMKRIVDVYESLRNEGKWFLGATRIIRKYTSVELNSAEILSFKIGLFIEPAGEECGTVYDSTSACPMCGAGARQATELFLKRRRISRAKDVSGTIAQTEWVASKRFFDLVQQHQLSGVDLPKVLPCLRFQGLSDPGDSAHEWYQIVVTSNPVSIVPHTRIGGMPFGELKPKCPFGHYTGLLPISEVSMSRAEWDGADIFQSRELFGIRRGLLRPFPILLVSQRFFRAFKAMQLRGATFEVAHLL